MRLSFFGKLKGWLLASTPGPPVISGRPTISGAPNGLLSATAAPTSNAVRTEWQWMINYVPVSGATAQTFASAGHPGQIAARQTSYAYDGTFATSLSLVFDNGTDATQIGNGETFEAGTNNQPINTISGLNLTVIGGDAANQAKLIVRQNGTSGPKVLTNTTAITPTPPTAGNSRPLAVYTQEIGINQRVEIDCSKGGTFTAPGDTYLRVVDELNYLWLQNHFNQMRVYNVVNGVPYDLISWAITGSEGPSAYLYFLQQSGFTSSYTLRVDVAGSILNIYEKVDGGPWLQAPIYRSGSNNTHTVKSLNLDMNAASADGVPLPQGTKAGVGPDGASSGIDTVRFYALNSPLIVLTAIPSTYDNVPSLSIGLEYSGASDPTGFDVAVMGEDGHPIVERTAATVVSIANGTAQISYADPTLRAVEGKNGYVQVWKTGSGNSGQEGAALPFAMPIYQTVFPYVQGINDGFLTGRAAEPTRDLMLSSDVRTGNNAYNALPVGSGMTFNRYGLPTSADPAHPEGFTFLLKASAALAADRVGDYIISYPAAYTIHSSNMTPPLSFNDAQGNPLPIMNGQKQARYTRPQSISPGAAFPLIYFTGLNNGAFGPDDQVTIQIEGDAHPERLVPDSTAANFPLLGEVARCMEGRYENFIVYKATAPTQNTKYGTADYPIWMGSNTQHGRPVTAEYITSLCNQAGIDMHFNAHHVTDEDYWRQEARYVAQNLAPGLNCSVEWSNEPWNSSFPVFTDAVVEAARLGFCDPGATSYAGLNPPGTIYFEDIPYAGPYVTSTAIPAGQLLIVEVHNKGKMVFRATHDNAAGTAVPSDSTGTADWMLVYGNPACNTARSLYQAYVSDRLYTIWDEEFAAAGRARPIHVFNVQSGKSVSSTVATQLSWVNQSGIPMYQRIDRLAIGPYWGGNYAGLGNLGDYTANWPSPAYTHPWTAAEKALVMNSDASGNPDFTAFKAAFFAIANDAIDYAVSNATLYKHDLARWLVGKGMSPDAIQLMSYECNWHVQFANWPTADPTYGNMAAVADLAFGYLIRSPEYGIATKRYLKLLAQRIGGTHMIYSRISGIPITGAEKALFPLPEQQWGLMESETDNVMSGAGTNYRFTAVTETRSGNFD